MDVKREAYVAYACKRIARLTAKIEWQSAKIEQITAMLRATALGTVERPADVALCKQLQAQRRSSIQSRRRWERELSKWREAARRGRPRTTEE